jgi:hypothetical protein
MSSGIVDQITLECLMNKETYNKIMANKNIIQDKNKDKKFYRKRISNLTKELLQNTPPENLMLDVTLAYENYVKTCINYFKIIDEVDIIQEDYLNSNTDSKKEDVESVMKESEDQVTNDLDIDFVSEKKDITQIDTVKKEESKYAPVLANNLMMRSIKLINPTLDNFLAYKPDVVSKKNEIIIPKQKEIDLTNPELKNKGICKKKNITNNYEDQE